MQPTLDSWKAYGLSCAGPTDDNDYPGWFHWDCSGAPNGVQLDPSLSGDAIAPYSAYVQFPAATPLDSVRREVTGLVRVSPAWAHDVDALSAWLNNWNGDPDEKRFGSTKLIVAVGETNGQPSAYVFQVSGPRRNLDEPLP